MKSIDETKRFGLTQSLLDAVKSVVAAEAEDNRSVDQINASKIAMNAAKTAERLAAQVGRPTAPDEDDMEPEDVPVDAEPEKEMPIDSDLDPVNDAENDKDFDDREDQDIDNDGDVDGSDEYLHKRRAATDDAIDAEDDQEEGLYADDEDPSDEDSDEDEDEDEEGEESDEDESEEDEEDDEAEDEDESDDEEDEDPEADDVPPEMDKDDEEESDEDDGEGEDEDGDVETRNVGDMSDDELEQELAMRKKKSKEEEDVDVNPQMEAYMRKISADISKRQIIEGTETSVKDVKAPVAKPKPSGTVNKAADAAATAQPVGTKSAMPKEELSDKQKQLDVNKDGKISGDDLAKLRASKKEQLMASKSYYEGKYGNRWETVMDKVAEKLAMKEAGPNPDGGATNATSDKKSIKKSYSKKDLETPVKTAKPIDLKVEL